MSKRKIGGYEISDPEDSEPESDPPPLKKSKGYAPATLTKSKFKHPSTPNSSSHPRASSSHPQTSSSRSQPAVTPGQKLAASSAIRTSFSTPRDTPNSVPTQAILPPDSGVIPSDGNSEDERAPESPVFDARTKGKARAQGSLSGPSNVGPAPAPAVSQFVFAHEVNELSERISNGESKGEGYEREIANLWKEVRKVGEDVREYTRMIKDHMVAQESWRTQLILDTSSALPLAPIANTSATNENSLISAPNLDFDPRADVTSTVPISSVTVIASIIATCKPRKTKDMPKIPSETQLKGFLRDICYKSLDNVKAQSDVKPFFYDCHGNPTLLPEECRDPVTGLCSYYPHWDKSLDGQAAWVHFVLERFRSTAPKNTTEYSVTLRTISEMLLVELFMKGPWETLKGGWRNLKKTDEEVEELRRAIRQARRPTAKARSRSVLRPEIPALAGEECDYIYHEGMQSGEESGRENPIIIWRLVPDNRSSYLGGLYSAKDECARKRREELSGNHFQPRTRMTRIIPVHTIPELKRGDKILKIPLYAFSSAWRKQHKDLFKTFAHRVDKSLKIPPDITKFLEQHAKPEEDADLNELPALPVPQQPHFDVGSHEGGNEDEGDKDGYEAGNEDKQGVPVGGDEEFGDAAAELDEEAQKEMEMNPEAAISDTFTPIHPANLDPSLIEPSLKQASVNEAAKPKTRPKPSQPDTTGEPMPSSAIRISIPPYPYVAPELPQPHPGHSTQSLTPFAPPVAYQTPPQLPMPAPQVPVIPFHPPPGTPHLPPPELPLPLSTAADEPPAKKSKKKKDVQGGKPAVKRPRGRPSNAAKAAEAAAAAAEAAEAAVSVIDTTVTIASATAGASGSGNGGTSLPVTRHVSGGDPTGGSDMLAGALPVIQKKQWGRPRKVPTEAKDSTEA